MAFDENCPIHPELTRMSVSQIPILYVVRLVRLFRDNQNLKEHFVIRVEKCAADRTVSMLWGKLAVFCFVLFSIHGNVFELKIQIP